MKNIQPLRMLPKFDSQAIDLEKISQSNSHPLSYEKFQLENSLLPRFHDDENQSADTAIKTISKTIINMNEDQEIDYRSNKFDIKFLERAYDRSGKKCWPAINTNIGKFDLEYTYEIVGNTLESYIHYRKLNQCKALSNFIEYRNKVYKREKIGQYALPEPKIQMKEIHTKQTINVPTKIIQIEEKQTPSVPPSPSPSIISKTVPSISIASSQSITPKTSEKLPSPISKEAVIPIPSPDLLRSPTPKQSKKNIPKKTNGNIKQTSSPSVKGSSPSSKSKVTIKSKIIPKKTLSNRHNKKAKQKQKTCNIL